MRFFISYNHIESPSSESFEKELIKILSKEQTDWKKNMIYKHLYTIAILLDISAVFADEC